MLDQSKRTHWNNAPKTRSHYAHACRALEVSDIDMTLISRLSNFIVWYPYEMSRWVLTLQKSIRVAYGKSVKLSSVLLLASQSRSCCPWTYTCPLYCHFGPWKIKTKKSKRWPGIPAPSTSDGLCVWCRQSTHVSVALKDAQRTLLSRQVGQSWWRTFTIASDLVNMWACSFPFSIPS